MVFPQRNFGRKLVALVHESEGNIASPLVNSGFQRGHLHVLSGQSR